MKRGQVTVFIVIGVIILFVVVSLFMLKGNTLKQDTKESVVPFIAPVKQFVDSCLESTAQQGLPDIAEHGGFYQLPEIYKDENGYQLPYYFFNEENTMPSKETIEDQFALYINDHMVDCVNDFIVFEEEGFTVTTEQPRATVHILPGRVDVQLTYPLQVEKDDQQSALRQFSTSIPYDFDEKITIITNVVNQQEGDPDYLPLSYLVDLAEEHDFTFEMLYFSDTTIGFQFLFRDSELYDPLTYAFALQYPEFEDPPEAVLMDDIAPVVPVIDGEPGVFVVPQGERFLYQIQLIEGEQVRFHDFTPLFDIDEETGVIEFDTTGVAPGKYEFTIQAEDELDNVDLQKLVIEIV